jgi:hypothetical protein
MERYPRIVSKAAMRHQSNSLTSQVSATSGSSKNVTGKKERTSVDSPAGHGWTIDNPRFCRLKPDVLEKFNKFF